MSVTSQRLHCESVEELEMKYSSLDFPIGFFYFTAIPPRPLLGQNTDKVCRGKNEIQLCPELYYCGDF